MAEKPSVWVYDLQHLCSGLGFGEASVHMAAPNRPKLYRKAEKQFGGDFHPPLLMTKGGLEHPMAIAVDNQSN